MLLILFPVLLHQVRAQVFPGLTGEALVEAIQNAYTPGQLLNDTQVKDTLYAKVFAKEDSVRCVYSGLARFLPSGVDPSQWLFGSGLETGSINLEHTWPQSKGAGEGTDGNLNMYHLFPSRTAINSDRGDFPFHEINDQQTTKWYYKDVELNNAPEIHIEYYSEYISGLFEPRESLKGDIARGMFYFWTIYREDALAADPNFFDLQADDLCLWHIQDPVDDHEILRNDIISIYQDGKKNPFILDCSLVMRAYCNEIPDCEMVATGSIQKCKAGLNFQYGSQQFILDDQETGNWKLVVVDQLGRIIYSGNLKENELSEPIDFPSGIYFAAAVKWDRVLTLKLVIP